MKAIDWIDQVKELHQIETDYAAAKFLGVSKTAVSKYRTHGTTLDEDVAMKVAAALGKRPEAVILDQLAERIRSESVRQTLQFHAASLAAVH